MRCSCSESRCTRCHLHPRLGNRSRAPQMLDKEENAIPNAYRLPAELFSQLRTAGRTWVYERGRQFPQAPRSWIGLGPFVLWLYIPCDTIINPLSSSLSLLERRACTSCSLT